MTLQLLSAFRKVSAMGMLIAAVEKLLKIFPFNSDILQVVRLLNSNKRLLLTERYVVCVAEKVLPDSTDDQNLSRSIRYN